MENIQKLQNSSELAAKHGEKFYKAELTDPNTNETSYVKRPIFVVKNKKDDGLSVHPAFLAKFFEMTEKIIFLRHSALGTVIRYIYKNGVYVQVSDNDIKKILKDYIEKFRVGLVSVWTISQALSIIDCGGEYLSHDKMNADERYINFQNGLLEIKNDVGDTGSVRLLPHTPNFFSTIQIPCEWKCVSQSTPVFDDFLNTLTGGDLQKQQILLEYLGTVISNVHGSRFKKAMFLVGKGNCGKSLILKLLVSLLGEKNSNERSLECLAARFGETALYMSRLVYSGDLSYAKIAEMNKFKQATGGDNMQIEYKNCEPFDYHFRGFLLYAMNVLPKFGGDKGSWVYDRIIVINCNNPIPKEKQDPHLLDKLFTEREGIIQKCVAALQNVIANNYQFHIPTECETALDDYKTENSVVVEFWKECVEPCEKSESCVNTSGQIYNAFRAWACGNGLRFIPSVQEFANEISQYLNMAWKWEIVKKTKSSNYVINYKFNDIGKNIAAKS